MKAPFYHGPGQKRWETAHDPTLRNQSDAIVMIDTTTIRVTDLHILESDVPEVTDGRILGHETVGTIVETGAAVEGFSTGDKMLISSISSCGRCSYWHRRKYGQCLNGGWDPRPPHRWRG